MGSLKGKIGNPEVAPNWERENQAGSAIKVKIEPGPLAHHSTVVFNANAYVLGGSRPNGSTNEVLYRYNIDKKMWEIARQREEVPG